MYREYARYARYAGHKLGDNQFMDLMRGERGELIRKAADEDKYEENMTTIKLLSAILWLIQLMAILVDTVLSVFSKEYKVGIYERTKPEIFKAVRSEVKAEKSNKIKDFQKSAVLTDKKLWD